MGPDTIWIFIPIFALLIPIVAILSSTASKYFKMREKQGKLGANSNEYEKEVGELKALLEQQRSSYEKRIANLETIITSQTWDTLHNKALSDEDRKFLMPDAETELETLSRNISDTKRVELLADKMK